MMGKIILTMFFVGFFIYKGSVLITDILHKRGCDTTMYTVFLGKEYVCMPVPDEGMPRNNEELMK